MRKRKNRKGYYTVTPPLETADKRITFRMSDSSMDALDQIMALMEKQHGLTFTRNILMRRALFSYRSYLSYLISQIKKAEKRGQIKRAEYYKDQLLQERNLLFKVSERDPGEFPWIGAL